MPDQAPAPQDPFAAKRYQKSFLKQVIVRVDWAVAQSGITTALAPTIKTAALKFFPIPEPKKIRAQMVTVTGAAVAEEQSESMQWLFHGKEREKTLSITAEAMFITYRKYDTFESLREEFFGVMTALVEQYPQSQASRVGLRYINEIELQEGNPLDWAPYIRAPMLCVLDLAEDKGLIARAFHKLELNYGDLFFNFQFGIANPDYPATVKRKHYVLDLDGSYTALQTPAEVQAHIDHAHRTIQRVFEASITDALRAKMND